MLGWYLKKRRERNERRLAEAEERARAYREEKLAAVKKVLKWHPAQQPVPRKDFVERRNTEVPSFLRKTEE